MTDHPEAYADFEPWVPEPDDDPYPANREPCVDCGGRFEEFICLSCGLTQQDIEDRLVKR